MILLRLSSQKSLLGSYMIQRTVVISGLLFVDPLKSIEISMANIQDCLIITKILSKIASILQNKNFKRLKKELMNMSQKLLPTKKLMNLSREK